MAENAGSTKSQTQSQRPKGKPRGKPFPRGCTPGPGRGNKNPDPLVNAAGLVADMDKAYTTNESPEDSALVKSLRRMAHKEPIKFVKMYAQAKSQVPTRVEAASTAAVSAAEVSVGPRELAVEELAERMLAEWEESREGS